jgi:hypothetical protein
MKHDWECVKKPWIDKAVDTAEAQAFRESGQEFAKANGLSKAAWWPKSAEKTVTRPGAFCCRTCGFVFQGNYSPPEDWAAAGVIPDCATEVAKRVQES